MNDYPDLPYRTADMQLSDIDEVMVIEQLSFASPWSVRAYRYELTHNNFSHFLVVRQNLTSVAAYATDPPGLLGRLFRPPSRSPAPLLGYGGFWLLVDEAHISTIAIAPAWRGMGLGEFLLIGLLERAVTIGADVATLEVRTSNEVAQNLYRKYRFQSVGLRRGYYRDNQEDALIMTTPSLRSRGFQYLLQSNKDSLFAALRRGIRRSAIDRASSQKG